MLGTPGQSNHAAANAFIDSLAHLRRSSGLPALAINWGVWTRIGAAAKRNVAGRMPIAGLRAIAPEQGLAILETLLDRGECQVGAFGMDWDIYAAEAAVRGPEAERLTGGRDRTLRLERTTQAVPQKRGSPASASLGHLDRIRQAQASRRVELLTRFVEDRIFKALGLDPSRPPDRSRPLQELGLDSLLAVELRNLIGNDLGLPRRLPATFLFDYPSIDAIANYLAGELLPPDDRLPAAEVLDVRAELAEVAILSDEEAETMLLKELNEN
jgi:acyl carrier protein